MNYSDYKSFHHVIENKPQICISGHKARHFTYLFSKTDYTIIKIGTSYCKKHKLLRDPIKNDLLIIVLREFIESSEFIDYINFSKINLSQPIFNFTCSFIDKRISHFQNIILSTEVVEYYDYQLPLEQLKNDILDIKAEYFPIEKFPEYSENYFGIIERIDNLLNRFTFQTPIIYDKGDLSVKSNSYLITSKDAQRDSPVASTGLCDPLWSAFEMLKGVKGDEIQEKIENIEEEDIEKSLTNMQVEILNLINGSYNTEEQELSQVIGCVLDTDLIMNEQEKQEELEELERELEIEESIKQEIKEEEIDIFEEHERQEQQYIDLISEEYYNEEENEDIIKNILREITNNIKNDEKNDEKSLNIEKTPTELSIEYYRNFNDRIIENQKRDYLELFERIRKLREDIAEYKIEFAIFQNNLDHFKKNVEENTKTQHQFFLKHNIPWCLG